jgi:hypothetical protein
MSFTYLGPQLLCFLSLLFCLPSRRRYRFRRAAAVGTGRIGFLQRVLTLLGRAIPRLVYQHALHSIFISRNPRTEDARFGRLERFCFLYAAQFGLVRGTEECSVCGLWRVIRCSGMRSRDGR